MKTLKIMIIGLMMIVTSASAMTYDQAKQQALFLADKMAYELNLTEEQYEAAYEINLDYLMAVNDYNDLYGTYWTRRNLELKSILATWQYNAYIAADYFYRPVYWSNNSWNWSIYSYYPKTTWFNSRPTVYISYRGGNSRSYYSSRTWQRPSQRIVRTSTQRNINSSRTTTSTNRTFDNLNNASVNRTNMNITNVNVNNRTVNRVPNYSTNRSISTPSVNNSTYGTIASNHTFGKTTNSGILGSSSLNKSNVRIATTGTTNSAESFGGHR